jgi:hypothetical protein
LSKVRVVVGQHGVRADIMPRKATTWTGKRFVET